MADDDDVNTWLQGLQEHKELLAHLQESVNADPTNVEAKEVVAGWWQMCHCSLDAEGFVLPQHAGT